MANTRTLQVKFGTEGLDQVLGAYKRVAQGLDETFDSARKSIKIADDLKKYGEKFGLSNQVKAAEDQRAKAAQQANQAIANSYRELRIKSEKDIAAMKEQAFAAYRVIASASNDPAVTGRAQEALSRRLKELDGQLRSTANEARNMGDGFTVAKGALASFLGNIAFGAFQQFQQTVVGTIKSFVGFGLEAESLKVRLETAFNGAGKSAAQAKLESDAAYKSIQQFANVTPFESTELVDGFVKFRNRGITPTIDELTKLGDLTSSQGKSFGQYTEAVLDAMTGQNERLREFGIDAKTVGDKVSFTFKGVTKTVGKETPDAIYKALLSFGALDGVVGGMARQAETGSGKISTLSDAWKEFGRSVYALVEPAFKSIIDSLTKVLTTIDTATFLKPLRQDMQDFAVFAKSPEGIKTLTEGMVAAIKGLIDIVKLAAEAVRAFGPPLIKVAKFVLDWKDAILLLFEAWAGYALFGKIATAIGGLVKAFKDVSLAMTAAQGLGLAAIGPAGWIALLGAAVVVLASNWDTVTDAVNRYVNASKEAAANDARPNTSESGTFYSVRRAGLFNPDGSRVHQYSDLKAHHDYQKDSLGRFVNDVTLEREGKTKTAVPSAQEGSVTYAGYDKGYGNFVEISSQMGQTLVAHLDKILVKVGEKVEKGQTLGIQGSTGRSTGPHVHIASSDKKIISDWVDMLVMGVDAPEQFGPKQPARKVIPTPSTVKLPDPKNTPDDGESLKKKAPPSGRARLDAFLDLIAKTEGADYNTLYGGKTFKSFEKFPANTVSAGRYQFKGGTFGEIQSRIGLKDFGPDSQDKAAIELLREKGALPYILKGDWKGAIAKLVPYTWTSLPGGNKPRATMAEAIKFLNDRLTTEKDQTAEQLDKQRSEDISAATIKAKEERERKRKEAIAGARRVQDLAEQTRNEEQLKRQDRYSAQTLAEFDSKSFADISALKERGIDTSFLEQENASKRQDTQQRLDSVRKIIELEQALATVKKEQQRYLADGKKQDAEVYGAKAKYLQDEIKYEKELDQTKQNRAAIEQAELVKQSERDRQRQLSAATLGVAQTRKELDQFKPDPTEPIGMLEALDAQAISQFDQIKASIAEQIAAINALIETRQTLGLQYQEEQTILDSLKSKYDEVLGLQQLAVQAAVQGAVTTSGTLQELLAGQTEQTATWGDTLKSATQNALEGVQGILGSLLDGTQDLGQQLLGVVTGFLKQIANFFASKAIQSLMGSLFGGGGGGGNLFGSLLSSGGATSFSFGGGGLLGALPSFHGGGHTGSGGEFLARLTGNEFVMNPAATSFYGAETLNRLNNLSPVLPLNSTGLNRSTPRAGGAAGGAININVTTPNADSFRSSEGQIGAVMAEQLLRARGRAGGR